jgi:hypothetical protein
LVVFGASPFRNGLDRSDGLLSRLVDPSGQLNGATADGIGSRTFFRVAISRVNIRLA